MLMCVDASGSPIIIFVCIFAASSSSSSSAAAAAAAAANDFSTKLSYEKGGVKEPKSLRLIHLTAVTFNPSTKAPISALDFVFYLHLLTDIFSI